MKELRCIEKLYCLERKLYNAFNARGIRITFGRVYSDKSTLQYGFFEVSMVGLPDNIQPESLSNPNTEQMLCTAIAHQVKAIKGNKLTYCIKL